MLVNASMKSWLNAPQVVLDGLQTNINAGLTRSTANQRLREFGRNELPQPEAKSLFKLIIKQFEDTLVLILLAAAFGMMYTLNSCPFNLQQILLFYDIYVVTCFH